MKKTKFTFDLSKLKKLVFDEKKKTIFLDPEAEEVWIEILRAEKQLEELKKEAKKKMTEYIEKLNVPFEKLKAEKVIVSYAYSGKKYLVDEADLDKLPKELYKTKITYSVISDAVEKWAKAHDGKLPVGILVNQKRQKGIKVYPKRGVEL